MNGMTAFLVAAGALLIIVIAILLRPLLRASNAAALSVDRRRANLSILREELRELERNRDDGALSEDDFEQARRELQRRLLEETTATEKSTPPKSASGGRSAAIASRCPPAEKPNTLTCCSRLRRMRRARCASCKATLCPSFQPSPGKR